VVRSLLSRTYVYTCNIVPGVERDHIPPELHVFGDREIDPGIGRGPGFPEIWIESFGGSDVERDGCYISTLH
jgi:hypothetical protein